MTFGRVELRSSLGPYEEGTRRCLISPQGEKFLYHFLMARSWRNTLECEVTVSPAASQPGASHTHFWEARVSSHCAAKAKVASCPSRSLWALSPSLYTNSDSHKPFFTTLAHPQACHLSNSSTPGLCKGILGGRQMGKPGVASCQDSSNTSQQHE